MPDRLASKLRRERRAEGYSYWRQIPQAAGLWPIGGLCLGGLGVLFLIGLFGIAPQIEKQTQATVVQALQGFGIEPASVLASGQHVEIIVDAPQTARAQIEAIAKSASCRSWSGEHVCPVSVDVVLSSEPPSAPPAAPADTPVAIADHDEEEILPAVPAVDPSVSEAVATAPEAHSFEFVVEEGLILLSGEVPDEKSHQQVLSQARKRFEKVADQLEVTGRQATANHPLAANRALSILEPAKNGVARWRDGELNASIRVTDANAALVRKLFNAKRQSPPLGELRLSVEHGAPASCDQRFAQVLGNASIQFETASASIQRDSMAVVEQLLPLFEACPGPVVIEGHTDNQGNTGRNERLSWRRAASVREALVQRGVAPQRLRIIGHGESRPIANNLTEAGRALNRRIAIRGESGSLESLTPAACDEQLAAALRAEPISYAVGSDDIDTASETFLSRLAVIMQQCDNDFVIEGHTDNQGLAARNQQLSQRRAESVKAALVDRGIAARRMQTIGYGEQRPIVPNTSARERERNRRIEIRASDAPLPTRPAIIGGSGLTCQDQLEAALARASIRFRMASDEVEEASQQTIDNLATIIRRCPGHLVIAGHTDNVGEPRRNRRLSLKRAEAVKRELVRRGIPDTRLSTVGYGESTPIAPNHTEAGRLLNRRIEIRLDEYDAAAFAPTSIWSDN